MLTNQFPGVHVLEIPSGARPIASLSTSNTAFVGVFRKGPLDDAIRITSWADFEKIFGGLWVESDTSYAVRQYFQNGGAVAFIVRVGVARAAVAAVVADPVAIPPVVAAPAIVAIGLDRAVLIVTDNINPADAAALPALTVTALNEGSWGNDLRIGIGLRTGADIGTTYDLVIRSYKGNQLLAQEVYQAVSISAASPRYADRVVNGVSTLVTVVAVDTRLPRHQTPVLGSAPARESTLQQLKDVPKTSLLAMAGGGDGILPSIANWQAPIAAALVGSNALRTGMNALEDIIPDIFNLMCLPIAAQMPVVNATAVYEAAEAFCRDRFAFLIVDPGIGVAHAAIYATWFSQLGGAVSRNAAGYFPALRFDDPEAPGTLRDIGPSGMVAGMMARIDASRGIWKSAAGTETRFSGGEPAALLTDLEQEPLNRLGVNVIRSFPVYGNIIWGARTLAGADDLADEYKYAAVRRTALFIQQSLQRGLKWTVFEGNDETLWGQIRLNVKAFMQGLHRQGAFQGNIAADAYLVKCDSETTPQSDIDLGIVNILVAFAPLKPAEFVLLNFTQLTKLPE